MYQVSQVDVNLQNKLNADEDYEKLKSMIAINTPGPGQYNNFSTF